MVENIYEKSREGRRGLRPAGEKLAQVAPEEELEGKYLREESPRLPQVSLPELVRHYTELSQMNYGVDSGFYPLGSCTMKYNPKLGGESAQKREFSDVHPLRDEDLCQGDLALIYRLGEILKGIAGMEGVTLQPAAGAGGELAGMLIIRRYQRERGDLGKRREILLPDSAHGTNPASANIAGFEVREVESNERGTIDVEKLRSVVGEKTAGIMLTIPNTLGIFESEIRRIADIVHRAGGLCYMDGANMNALLGKCRPGDMGMDIMHFNLHKTFATPHGGGGPGAGPLAVTEELLPYLPLPTVEKDEEEDRYYLDWDRPDSIGKVSDFYGNFGVMVRALSYILALGDEGLEKVSENAVLNANYLKEKLKDTYEVPYPDLCKHEFVASGAEIGPGEVDTRDIAKRLLDYGFHPPTVYFPLIVKEALMIEPTETETKETLDAFVRALKEIACEAERSPDLLEQAPVNTPVRRLDQTKAARSPVLREQWEEEG